MKGHFENLPGRVFRIEFEETPGAVLVDVRTPGEFRQGHLDGALNIDFMCASFTEEFGKLPKDKTYFLYCRSGNRSGQAGMMMSQLGYNVRNLIGGISEWPTNVGELAE